MTDWTFGEKSLVAAAAALAPSVHNTQPWVLEFRGDDKTDHEVWLFERFDRPLPRQDPLGRDRLISCGTVLAHVLLAMRVLGWVPDMELRPDRAHPDKVACVRRAGRCEASEVELSWYRVITARRSHRRPFAARTVPDEVRRALLGAHGVDGVGLRVVSAPAEIGALAGLLNHSALVQRADHAYQRELNAWTTTVRDPFPGMGMSLTRRRTATLPWAGLVGRTTAIPDVGFLADRLSREFLVLVETPDDGPLDHVRAGLAAERTWLAAVVAGLVGSVPTQPFPLPEARAGLVEALSLNGFPQLLLRFGHPRGEVT